MKDSSNTKNQDDSNKKDKKSKTPLKKPPQRTRSSNRQPQESSSQGFLTKYFLVILFVFACVSLFLNSHFTHVIVQDVSAVEQVLESSIFSSLARNHLDAPTDDWDKPQGGDDDGNDNNNNNKQADSQNLDHHDLNCDVHGGPDYPAAQEMVYWKDIPSDNKFISQFHHLDANNKHKRRQFMTFEPDHGGWNNIRMAMETVLTMAFAMGRTLILPPHQKMYLLHKADDGQRNAFSFEHFFHMERIHQEHLGLDIISMDEFLRDYVLKGWFVNPTTKQPMFPPNNRTDWNGCKPNELNQLNNFLRNNISNSVLLWSPETCLAAFPTSSHTHEQHSTDIDELHEIESAMIQQKPNHEVYIDNPTPVDASPKDRLQENWAGRKNLCVYDKQLQETSWVHFPVQRTPDGNGDSRMLVHFYAFLFFQDWQQDLWMKRFVRDHVRYIDEIQCAAARIVQGIRQHVLRRTNGNSSEFDSMHVRRGDFQYKVTRVEAADIYDVTKRKIPDGTTVYIGTDERKKEFFDPLKQHYDVIFLDDFLDRIPGVNTNYYGMIDQLVASRGRIFFGCWFSTFTGYINRLRGYHHHKEITHDESMGIIPSYYYAVKDRYDHMQHYWPVKKSFYAREFPTSWRLIDTGVDLDQVDKEQY